METNIFVFIIWCILGSFFILLAVYALFSKKPIRFWANVDMFQVSNVKKYNCAVSKLFAIFGLVLIILGSPLLAGQNSAWVLFSVIGLMIEVIIAMAVYSLVIEKKYKKM